MPDDDLQKLLKYDEEIEDLEADVVEAAAKLKEIKADLKALVKDRRRLSSEIRNPPPLFAGEPDGEHGAVPDSVSFSGSDFDTIKQAGKALRKQAAAEARS